MSYDLSKNSLIGPMDKKTDDEALDKIITARISLLLKEPFFGNLVTRLKLVNADSWLETLATDGRSLFYNAKFVNMLDHKETIFGLCHEILHCIYEHMGRKGDRIMSLWNVANDYCVNADLVSHSIGRKITTIEILYEPKYKDWTSEDVYDDLMKDAKSLDMDDLLKKMLDEHLEVEGEEEGDGDGDGEDGSGDGGSSKPKISKADLAEIRDEFKEAVLNAASAAGNAGNVPGNIKKFIKNLTAPQLDWKELLSISLTSAIREDYSWSRTNRKAWHMDAIMPGMTPGEATNIALAIDTSGSISQSMLLEFLSEVQGIMEAFTSYKIHLFCFDTSIHNPKDFSSDDIDDLTTYELGGFGGTDFDPIFTHLKEEDVIVDRLVVISDGYPYGSWCPPGLEDMVDTLWILHGTNSIVAPFGQTVYFDDAKR